jgi:hypothetical protein
MSGAKGEDAMLRKTMIAATLSAVLAISPASAQQAADSSAATVDLPRDNNVLFWTVPQRDLAFRLFDSVSPAAPIRPGAEPLALPVGTPLAATRQRWTPISRTSGSPG